LEIQTSSQAAAFTGEFQNSAFSDGRKHFSDIPNEARLPVV
jgi:hypothetical protein